MTFEERLRQELVETRDKYYKAKNNYMAAKNGLKPAFVKESIELLRQEKASLGYYLKVLETKCDLYGVEKK